MSPGELWQQVLAELRLAMTHATFETLFAYTTGETEGDGALTVGVPTTEAKAWIETRFSPLVHRTLRGLGYAGSVVFQLHSPLPRSGPLRRLPTPGPDHLKPGDVALTFLNFDLYARGWLRTPSYYELFWQPVLGYVAYAYWRLTQVLYWRNPELGFTRRARLDIQDSAANLGVSRDLIRGKPARGLGGALKTLRDHGLAEVERHAAGRATVYIGRFRRQLPLLAPSQVAQLTQSQQQQHLDWLLAAGCDPTAWEALGRDYRSFAVADPVSSADVSQSAAVSQSEATPFVAPAWESDQLSQTGFLRTPVYYDLFLQPLIGPVSYAVWRVCKCLNWSHQGEAYTRETVTSVYSLAAMLDCHRQKITGVKRRGQDGRAYWQEGAFDKLRRDRLALVREEGEGSALAYRLLVVNEPPLLCPAQVERFPAMLQPAHAAWLKSAQLQLAEWQQLPMESLLTLLE
jgi:hypothetical protein